MVWACSAAGLGLAGVLVVVPGAVHIPWRTDHEPVPNDVCDRRAREAVQQLEKQAAKGFFGEAAKGGLPAGPGAQVVGPGGVIVNGDNHGSINTGTVNTGGGGYFGGAVNAQQVVGGNQFNLGRKRDGR